MTAPNTSESVAHAVVLVLESFAFFASLGTVYCLLTIWRRTSNRHLNSIEGDQTLFTYACLTFSGFIFTIISFVQTVSTIVSQNIDIFDVLPGCHGLAVFSSILWSIMQATVVLQLISPSKYTLSSRRLILIHICGILVLITPMVLIGVNSYGSDADLCYTNSTSNVIPIILVFTCILTFIIALISPKKSIHTMLFSFGALLTLPYPLILLLARSNVSSNPSYLIAARSIFIIAINLLGPPLLFLYLFLNSFSTRQTTSFPQTNDESRPWSPRSSWRRLSPKIMTFNSNRGSSEDQNEKYEQASIRTWGDSQYVPSVFISENEKGYAPPFDSILPPTPIYPTRTSQQNSYLHAMTIATGGVSLGHVMWTPNTPTNTTSAFDTWDP